MHSRPRWRPASWTAIIVAWSMPALTDIADSYVSLRLRGTPGALWRTIARVAPGWYVWVILTPAIWWLGARFPLGRRVRPVAIAVHVVAGAVVACIHAGVLAGVTWIVPEAGVPPDRYVNVLIDWLPVSMLLYWAVLAAGYALENFRRATELSSELARAQLTVLRAQLHPHFLFNTLNAAVALVRTHEVETAARVLTHLSEILRHVLHDDTVQEIPLRDELTLLDRYLEIERTRFGARLTTAVCVPHDLGDALVPSLLLQPLVENAVRHGVARREAPVRVDVDVRAHNGTLHLLVTDDGPGLPTGWTLERATGVGLGNTRARLTALYGDEGRLDVRPSASGGVEADITLPLRRA